MYLGGYQAKYTTITLQNLYYTAVNLMRLKWGVHFKKIDTRVKKFDLHDEKTHF